MSQKARISFAGWWRTNRAAVPGVGNPNELDGEATGPVYSQEQSRNRHRRARAPGKQPEDHEQYRAFEQRLVELRGMTRNTAGARPRKHHAPGQARFAAPKAAVDIGIGHAVNPDGARELELAARRYFDNIGKLTVTALGPGLGVHGGPGTLLIATGPYWSAQDVARGID